MKTYILIPAMLLLLPLFAASAVAQEQPKKGNAKQETSQNENRQSGGEEFVDEDGDGINDRREEAGQEESQSNRKQIRNRRRDHFIDVDGDGINDERCNGLGVHSGARRGQQKGGGQ
ncbi:hypothetical protein KQI65_11710 [bacterium]|nr:hypothetical protein [bacterium]